MQNKTAEKPMADVTPDMSWLKLWIPGSALNGGVRYPKIMGKLFKGNPHAAFLVSAMGASALLGVGLTAAVKGLAQSEGMDKLRKYTEPDYNIRTQLGTTFNSQLAPGKKKKQNKTASEYTVPMPGPLSSRAVWDVALPMGAFLTAAALTYKGMDNMYDERRNAELDKSISRKSTALRQLMQARARLAKGTASDAEVEAALAGVPKEDTVVKTASLRDALNWIADNGGIKGMMTRGARKTNVAIQLLIYGLGIASTVGAYKYFRASDPEQIKFKAYKKALEAYSKNRALHTPVTILPSDASDYFAAIDSGAQTAKPKAQPAAQAADADAAFQEAMRSEPELNNDSRKPLSIVL